MQKCIDAIAVTCLQTFPEVIAMLTYFVNIFCQLVFLL